MSQIFGHTEEDIKNNARRRNNNEEVETDRTIRMKKREEMKAKLMAEQQELRAKLAAKFEEVVS